MYANVYFRLRGWYTAGGHAESVKSLSRAGGGGGGGDFNSPLYSFQEATEARLGEKLNLADSYSVVATINTIRVENSIYKACPVESCKKKVSHARVRSSKIRNRCIQSCIQRYGQNAARYSILLNHFLFYLLFCFIFFYHISLFLHFFIICIKVISFYHIETS